MSDGLSAAEPVAIRLALGEGISARVNEDRRSLALTDTTGAEVARYSGLAAFDAKGLSLPAWLEVDAGGVSIQVADADAVYPIVVDPLVQVGPLTVSDGSAGDLFGLSVAVSGDTIVVGSPGSDVGANLDQGSAYVFGDNLTPNTPANQTPPSDATGVALAPSLTWSGGDPNVGDTVTYTVFFCTANPPTSALASCTGISATQCLPGALSAGITYLWQVVATDNFTATATGPVLVVHNGATDHNVDSNHHANGDTDRNRDSDDDPGTPANLPAVCNQVSPAPSPTSRR